MRNDWRVRAIALLGSVLAVAGCTSTQPDSVGTRTASVRIIAKAEADLFNCYEIWADEDDNGTTTFQGFIECYPLLNDAGNQARISRNTPWRYAVTISVIRAGTTTEEIVTSLSGVLGSSVQPNDGIDDFVSLTDYDPTDQPPTVFKPPEFRSGYGFVSFLNGRSVSRGSRFYLAPIGIELGEANILTLTPSFDFSVNSGDTIVVRARKQLVADAIPYLPTTPDPQLVLSGLLSVGGALVSPSGIAISEKTDGAGISFSFTVQ